MTFVAPGNPGSYDDVLAIAGRPEADGH